MLQTIVGNCRGFLLKATKASCFKLVNARPITWFLCCDYRSAMDSIVFKEMKQYLSDIVTASHDRSSAADRGSEASGGRGGSESEENVRAAHVELLNLFTEVAGIVRQKSRAQTYTNHCYTVDRHSKTVIVDVCKGDSC